MEYKKLLEQLIPAIEGSFPDKSNYISKIAKILVLTNRTVSRKLRGEIQFTADELIVLARELNISLDTIATGKIKHKHLMYLSTFDWSGETELEEAIKELTAPYLAGASSVYSKFLVATSTYPATILYDIELLAKFDCLKWLYFNKGYASYKPLSEYFIDRDFHKIFYDTILKFKQSIYILSIHMMLNLAEEILYFYRLKLLRKDDVKHLKDTLQDYLSKMENICKKGTMPGVDKEITLYYSEMNLPNDLMIIDSDKIKMAHIVAFFQNTFMAKEESIDIIKQWFHTYLRTANIISISGELKRREFFRKQYADLDNKLGGI